MPFSCGTYDALFLRDVCRLDRTVRVFRGVRPIAERSAFYGDALAAHREQPVGPVPVPHFVVPGGRNPRIEANSAILPALVRADRVEQLDRVVVRMVMPEGVLGVPVEVLLVEKSDSSPDGRFANHHVHRKK